MPPTPDDPLQFPQQHPDPNVSQTLRRIAKSPLPSGRPPFRHSNPSFSNLFASTTSLPGLDDAASLRASGTVTPPVGAVVGSVFSPGGSAEIKSPPATPSERVSSSRDGVPEIIARAFSPHVSVLASKDAEELVRHKGVNGGLLELLRPFGEHVSGKVTIRDSSGVSRSWDNFGIRFIGVNDGLEPARSRERGNTQTSLNQGNNAQKPPIAEYRPARLRTGGDVIQIEELVERHLTFAEEHSGPVNTDYVAFESTEDTTARSMSPFYSLYLRRLLSGLPLVPSETFSHPATAVIAISSRSKSPIEDLRNLYDSSNTGEHRLPQWIHNEFLRYYVLIHDEDYDDITKSVALYDQMKRHFGLHCHLLRLRSTQCVSSDDDTTRLPTCEWISASEELAEIVRRETNDDDEDPTPYIFESDAAALRTFVREMVTQSIIPSMERASTTWNDQVASRRRGLSGRFISISKRFTTFGNRNSTGSLGGVGGGGNSGNYDSALGFYRPDAPEAIMRKLADYALMLRDYRLAQSTYDILCQDFKSDKAWRHYAAANEMAAVASLLAIGSSGTLSSKFRIETIDQYLETAYYSYMTRVGAAPFYALRCLLLGMELLKSREGSALDDAARWANKILEDRLVGLVGHALLLERIGTCYADRKGVGTLQSGKRHRKAAFWNLLSTDAWLRLDKSSQAERRRLEAVRLYSLSRSGDQVELGFEGMVEFLRLLKQAVDATRSDPRHLDAEDLLGDESDLMELNAQQAPLVETLQTDNEKLSAAGHSPVAIHRRSVSMASASMAPFALPPVQTTGLDSGFKGADIMPLSPHAVTSTSLSPARERIDDGFE